MWYQKKIAKVENFDLHEFCIYGQSGVTSESLYGNASTIKVRTLKSKNIKWVAVGINYPVFFFFSTSSSVILSDFVFAMEVNSVVTKLN